MRSFLTLAIVALSACAPNWKQAPHDRAFQQVRKPIPHVAPMRASVNSDWWDLVQHSVVLPLAQVMSPARYVGLLVEGRRALDTNSFGLVPDSSWFQNRLGQHALSPEDIAHGAVHQPGPAAGPLTIVSGKTEGATAGFVVQDSQAVIWFLKFDPPESHELTTGAEIIASRLLHAVGYYVPEMHIESLAVDRLVLSPTAKTRNRYNQKVQLTQKQMSVLLSQLNPSPEGTLRALFSRAIPGQPLGPFQYRGIRLDDPNDHIPHERRRSLRGLWVFSAWLANHDTRDVNTLDTFIPTSGKLGHVLHYLLDFGDALGATATRVKHLSEGYEHRADWAEMGKRAATLGLTYPYWLAVRRSPILAVGVFESKVFEPSKWAPRVPNPAFDEATSLDTFWAASILARFTEAHIKAAVDTAKYSGTEAATVIARVLRERQHKLLRFAFADMLGVAEPVVEDGVTISLIDLEVFSGVHTDTARYQWNVRWNRTRGGDVFLYKEVTDAPQLSLVSAIRNAQDNDQEGLRKDPFLTARMQRVGKTPGVEIHLRVVGSRVIVVGMRREID